jgi:hypothetical protein
MFITITAKTEAYAIAAEVAAIKSVVRAAGWQLEGEFQAKGLPAITTLRVAQGQSMTSYAGLTREVLELGLSQVEIEFKAVKR